MKYSLRYWLSCALAVGFILGDSALALAQSDDGTTKTEVKTTTTKKHHKKSDDSAVADANADNTGENKRDRAAAEPTADQQKNNKSDLDVTAEIRRSVMADKSLSVNAHNIKIIAQNGVVTLKGPVHSDAEKTTIEQKAMATAGKANVKSEIEVKP